MRPVLLLSLRSLASNRLRFALTSLAVMIGVAFVVASFVLSDGLRATFNTIVEDANSEIDATVRSETDFDAEVAELASLEEHVPLIDARRQGVADINREAWGLVG